MKNLKQKLIQAGRNEFDRIQANLSLTVKSTDTELESIPDPVRQSFGGPGRSPEDRRISARTLQDSLDAQGRESYALEYAESRVNNFQVR